MGDADTLAESGHSSSRRSYAPGDLVASKYQLVRKLEEGGMGAVWVALDRALDVQVALKLVRPDRASPELSERLLREAHTAARLTHPAIVRVHDVGATREGDAFMVMELLDGEPLAEMLARERRLDPINAARTLLPIAGALAVMHDKGLVHRDVKPENIFLTRDDAAFWQPKLIDFGIARHGGAARLTARGALMGTPGYMAPEQVRGADADARADVWALSAVLYETIAGVLPFEGATMGDLLGNVVTGRPRPLADHGVHDAELWSIVERGLRSHDERWPSMRALGHALAVWLWARGVTEDVTGMSLRRGWLGEDDMRRLASAPLVSRVRTQRLPALSTGSTEIAHRPIASPVTEPPTTTASIVAPRPAPPRSGRVAGAVLTVLLLAAAAATFVWRCTPPTTVASAAPPEPMPTAPEPAVTATTSASAPGSSASLPPPPVRSAAPPRRGPAPGKELKNPFQ